MTVKIINVLKDDSFNDILELFRQAPAGEVILVLPRTGKLFSSKDHFAAFAVEAESGKKKVAILTANPHISELARTFGFSVMLSGAGAKSRDKKDAAKKSAALLATAPPPADDDIPNFDDTANPDGDVPVTSDETMGNEPTGTEDDETNQLHGMQILDDEGNPVATLTAKRTANPVPLSSLDGIRGGMTKRTLSPSAKIEKASPVPIQGGAEPDYIDAMWRDKVGRSANHVIGRKPSAPSFLSRTLSQTSRAVAPRKIAVGILIAAVVVLGLTVYLITGSARVELVPVGKPLDTQITVQASDVFTSVDDAFAKIPGQLLEVSKTAENTVSASGTRDVASKARGTITVYNAYSSTPQTFVATTRFESEGGKLFRTLQTISVPGSTVKAGALVPGSIKVEVIADKPGPDYNIPAGKFIVVAFREKGDKDRENKFYGQSDAAMTGGAFGPSSVVTQTDYNSAKDAAVQSVKEQITSALAAQGAEFTILNSDNPVFKDMQSTADPDDTADAVTVTATGTLKTVAFRQSDLLDLICRSILKKERLVVLPNSLQLSYSDIVFKPDLGVLVFTVEIKTTGYTPIDTDAIGRDIQGKNREQIMEYFKDREGVQSAKVTLSPFWVQKVPSSPGDIDLHILYESDAESSR